MILSVMAFANSNTAPLTGAMEMAAPKDTTKQKKPRYSVRKTTAENQKEAEHKSTDLRDPDNLQTEVSGWNDTGRRQRTENDYKPDEQHQPDIKDK